MFIFREQGKKKMMTHSYEYEEESEEVKKNVKNNNSISTIKRMFEISLYFFLGDHWCIETGRVRRRQVSPRSCPKLVEGLL